MGNFEKLSVLVIVVIIVMILVVALYAWTDKPQDAERAGELAKKENGSAFAPIPATPPQADPSRGKNPWDLWDNTPGGDRPSGEGPGGDGPGGDGPRGDGPRGADVPPVPEPVPPTPPVDPEPQPEADGPWTYTVKPGDTLSQICERELGTWRRQNEVMALNKGLDPLRLRPGMQLKMPPRGRASSTREPAGGATPPSPSGPAGAARLSVKRGDYYVMQAGDRLSTVAKRAYGSIDRWPELWARNLSVIKDPDAVDPGTRIFIPE